MRNWLPLHGGFILLPRAAVYNKKKVLQCTRFLPSPLPHHCHPATAPPTWNRTSKTAKTALRPRTPPTNVTRKTIKGKKNNPKPPTPLQRSRNKRYVDRVRRGRSRNINVSQNTVTATLAYRQKGHRTKRYTLCTRPTFHGKHRACGVRNGSRQALRGNAFREIFPGIVARSICFLPSPQCCWYQPIRSQLTFPKWRRPCRTKTKICLHRHSAVPYKDLRLLCGGPPQQEENSRELLCRP